MIIEPLEEQLMVPLQAPPTSENWEVFTDIQCSNQDTERCEEKSKHEQIHN